MNTKEIFAKRLFELRESRGVSRQELADELEITRSSLEYYEKAKRTPDIGMIAKIAIFFDVSTDYLFGLVDVATTDIKKKEVCEYLGLSEPVVNRLKSYMGVKSKNILNELLVVWELTDFINIIEKRREILIELIDIIQRLRREVSKEALEASKIEQLFRDRDFCQDKLDLQTFRLTQSVLSLSDEYMRQELAQHKNMVKELKASELYQTAEDFLYAVHTDKTRGD